ncbi:16S rRNA (guanine(966)-N(2))-methyltransferase RsmD [Marinicauda salina]|uniref:16S rRNA (Guanine(966)-N(2))-methyltransferase RsmD n=1 Tax=Marinicauda salina TaxID=2135793 RepID=A0A2U2BUN8_9PROT|nr:16S rRNA (guanine(966)-N(2))-methyltransferase RsmD [Marinicauda salina]PWE17707.1 16S rRNA (guanine(966)-N(2))-methyltransferase RsmD [Marinicauda salina]
MRIVGGEFKGRPLAAPKGRATRPTADRTREAVFNKLAHAPWSAGVAGRRVIDLFAGSGALGFEAMSRAAEFCLFVETDAAARGAIRANVETLGLWGNTRIHRRDATQLGDKPANVGPAFDLVFLDPPYGKGLGEKALARLIEGGWVAEDAVAVFEVGADEAPETPGWDRLDDAVHGAARVVYLKRG